MHAIKSTPPPVGGALRPDSDSVVATAITPVDPALVQHFKAAVNATPSSQPISAQLTGIAQPSIPARVPHQGSPGSSFAPPYPLFPSIVEPAPAPPPPAVALDSDSASSTTHSSSDSDLPPDTLGAAVLQSLFNQSSAAVVQSTPLSAPATPVASTARIENLQRVLAETVTRVLVSDPLHDGRQEVRIEFAREVLPDTEVRLWRQEGRLHVEFLSTTATSETHRLPDGLARLAEVIHQRQPQPELPVVTLRLQDSPGQPGDGRSRQQYHAPQENEDQA